MVADKLRFLLLQVRDADDPMRRQEVGCFARALACNPARITAFSLIDGHREHGAHIPSRSLLDANDVVLFGGSGDYSVAAGGPALERAFEVMHTLVDLGKPTFASCWGFQAMAAALGGTVVTDLERAELGMLPIDLTEAGMSDPVFGPIGPRFDAPMGHQDIVERLPEGAILLASTDRYAHQAFDLGPGVLGLQFHPEVTAEGLEAWFVGHTAEIAAAGLSVPALRAYTAEHAATLKRAGTAMLGRWLDALEAD